jgi:formyl-CoA transferase
MTRDGSEWEQLLSTRGVPCGLVRDIGQVCDRTRSELRGLVLPTKIPEKSAGVPPAFLNAGFVFGHDGPGVDAAPPMLGEHSEEVLASLSYSEEQRHQLLDDGAVWARP